jgi:hypothetical protein
VALRVISTRPTSASRTSTRLARRTDSALVACTEQINSRCVKHR